MKRFVLSLILGLGLAISANASAAETCSKTDTRKNGDLPVCIAIDAATSTVTSATIDGFPYRSVGVEIWSNAGSSAVINVDCRISSTAPWVPCYTTSDPGATYATGAKYVSLARAFQYRVDIPTYVSGTIHVHFERYSN